jgi:nucleoside-diphosphate-sugar epimerase
LKVLVTGGNGEVGQTVVRRLAKDHRVRVADIVVPQGADRLPSVEWMACDLTTQDAADAAVDGQDAVIHLAAIPNSFVEKGPEVLRVNVQSCYTIAEACRRAGTRKLIYAGSDSGLGFGIRAVNYMPDYLPIDADHICRPHESYSFSKYFGERIFEEYARAFRVPTLSIRLLYVLLDRRCKDEFLQMMANRGREDCVTWMGGYVMPEDVAGIMAKALDYDVAGGERDFPYEVFFAHAADTLNRLYTDKPTLELAAKIWGRVPRVARSVYYEQNPCAPFFDIGPVRERLGYAPQFTFRDYRYYTP